MDSDCMLYLVTNSDCMFISKSNQYGKLSLYLPTIQNACSSCMKRRYGSAGCTYPLFRMHVHRRSSTMVKAYCCTYPLFRMHVHLKLITDIQARSCTYPLFRMHVHPQINIILYNRHLLNVRALLFLLLYI